MQHDDLIHFSHQPAYLHLDLDIHSDYTDGDRQMVVILHLNGALLAALINLRLWFKVNWY